jgi:hypothetical protein
MTDLRNVSAQWASRPADERFLTLASLAERVRARRVSSSVADVALDVMRVRPADDSASAEIEVYDATGKAFGQLTHYAFGQLCTRAHSPAGYLRTLPPMMAAMNLQWSLETHETDGAEANDARILTRVNGHTSIAAVNSTSYGRIWDADIATALEKSIDTEIWKVPAASYSKRDPLKATTLYASDRDMFVFLVNEQAGIDVDGGSLRRGVIVWNSEVGSATFGIQTFLYDYVCDNRIVWGVKDFRELKIRHTSGGPHRFAAQAIPQLQAYAASSVAGIEATIRAAKAKEIGKDREDVANWLKARGFTAPQAKTAYETAERDPRNYNPRTVWGVVQGLTDSAHSIKNTNDRVDIERKAGALLDTVAV